MILAQKILELRKKNNLSQEELAEKLNVSRQSISKWESGTSIPDINKILLIAEFFGVSTDYLLKDNIEDSPFIDSNEDSQKKCLSIEEANDFINASRKQIKRIANGVAICITSPAPLIFFSMLSEDRESSFYLSNTFANTIGLTWLFISVAIGVALFISCSNLMKPYEYIENGDFDLAFGVPGILSQRLNLYLPTRTNKIITSVVLFIIGVVPVIITGTLNLRELYSVSAVVLLICLVAFGVYNLIICESEKNNYDKLLRQDGFDPNAIQRSKKEERISGIYWPIVVAIYLGWSFLSNNWGITWIIWPIAGLIYGALSSYINNDVQ